MKAAEAEIYPVMPMGVKPRDQNPLLDDSLRQLPLV